MTDDDVLVTGEVARFARLPLLTQRALIRLAVTMVDATDDEKRFMSVVFGRLAEYEGAPGKVREAVAQLRSLVNAVEHQVAMNKLARDAVDQEVS